MTTNGMQRMSGGVSYNKAFKSDSQRLAFSLRSSIAKRRSLLNAALTGLLKLSHELAMIRAEQGSHVEL